MLHNMPTENDDGEHQAAGGEGHIEISLPKDSKNSRTQQDLDRENNNESPSWLPGPGSNYLTEYPWLQLPRSSKATSTVGSAKSSRSRRSQKVTAKVKWCRFLFLFSIIFTSSFLVFYPLITHFIVEAAHANDSHPYVPSVKEKNCTLNHKEPIHDPDSLHAQHHYHQGHASSSKFHSRQLLNAIS